VTHVALLRQPSVCDCGDHGFVPLTLGLVAIVSPGDVSVCAAKRWNAQPRGKAVYARSTCQRGREYLHRFLLGADSGDLVDHINRDTLDNRRENLRFVSPSESVLNTVNPNKTGFKGVRSYEKGFVAEIGTSGRGRRHLGCYETAEQAAVAYDIAAESEDLPRHTNTSLGLISAEVRARIGVPVRKRKGR
jgi:hypothetical protein